MDSDNYPRILIALFFVLMLIAAVTLSRPQSRESASPQTQRLIEEVLSTQPAAAAVPEPDPSILVGKASFYDYHLCKLPSGKVVGRAPSCFTGEELVQANYGSQAPTCAARHVPRGTFLLVRNLRNGEEVLCKVNDYGPDEAIHPDRVLDLSLYAFKQIASLSVGIIEVEIKTVK